MELSDKHINTLNALLHYEHLHVAAKLDFISPNSLSISDKLLFASIGLIDEISRSTHEIASKIVVTASAILWTYKLPHWEGLKDFLIIALNRAGLSPSAIMVDEQFDRDSNTFSATQSLINQMAVTIYQIDHEVFISDKKFLLTNFQKRVWERMGQVKLLGISAPTSAGKSFVVLLKCIDVILREGGDVIYIVPTLSLVAQVSADFNEQLKKFSIETYRISTTYNEEDIGRNKIYVLTQEKAISAFSQSDTPFNNVKVLIVDEIQNVEKVSFEGDQRSKTLYDTLIEFRHSLNPDLTILAGPRVDGLKNMGVEVFNEADSEEEKTKDSPVVNITYSISKLRNKYFLNQYNDVLKTEHKIPIEDDTIIDGYGGAQYRDKFIQYLHEFISRLGDGSRNIIFSPTTGQARSTAIGLSNLTNSVLDDDRIHSLVKYIEDTVHVEYDLAKTTPKGIVYHHGKTPTHIRSVIERAIRDRLVSNVVCTTTLMQGVNLPAQNVIMRNPDLAIRSIDGVKPKLTPYEIANLRGRAGRLLKDLIGRIYILEEDSFEKDSEQGELFPEAEKSLSCGYGEKYAEHKQDIDSSLLRQVVLTPETNSYGFLVTYVRQIVLKHGERSRDRLLSVGIDLSQNQINDIACGLEQRLSIPREICYKNRYWDPLDLDKIYLQREKYDLPTNIADPRIEIKLEQILTGFISDFPQYYYKYFKVDVLLLHSVCISAKEWMKEKTLKEILNKPYFDSSDKIDDRISLLQRQISFCKIRSN